MNNKPVAWIDRQDLERLPHHDCWVNGQEHKNSVPLYTHPVKELTDEEIKAVYGEYFDVENCDWLQLQCIQAILKKARK